MKKLFVLGLIFLSVFLAGCPEETGYSGLSSGNADPNTAYYDSGNETGTENCGSLGEPCCKSVGTDAFGSFTVYNYCHDYLDCRMDSCVEGPEYEAYGRP